MITMGDELTVSSYHPVVFSKIFSVGIPFTFQRFFHKPLSITHRCIYPDHVANVCKEQQDSKDSIEAGRTIDEWKSGEGKSNQDEGTVKIGGRDISCQGRGS
jgi:hypothetical protein